MCERFRFRDGKTQGKRPVLEHNQPISSARFRVICNAPLRTSAFLVPPRGALWETCTLDFTFSSTNKDN